MMCFFNKENAFRMILFVSILIMGIYNLFFNQEHVYVIVPMLGLLIFILSITNTMVTVCEQINNNVTDSIYEKQDDIVNIVNNGCENNGSDEDNGYNIIFEIQKIKKKYLSFYFEQYSKYDLSREIVFEYWYLFNRRRIVRKVRRCLLYFYYMTITAIIVFLFLSHELAPYFENLNLGEWTILSFVIILFEILIKNELVEAVNVALLERLEIHKNKFISKHCTTIKT